MGGESIKPIRKRIHVYFLMDTYQPGEMILFQHGKPIKYALTRVERLIREADNPLLKRITKADQY